VYLVAQVWIWAHYTSAWGEFIAAPGRFFMETKVKIAAALVAGAALGAIVAEGVRAQPSAPTYFIADILAVIDPEALQSVAAKANAAVAAFGGKILAHGEKVVELTGVPSARIAVIRFDSTAKAHAWWNSAAQKEIQETILRAAPQRNFLVEGLPQ
jgi:uncharacterized protein (DUF1330 family)